MKQCNIYTFSLSEMVILIPLAESLSDIAAKKAHSKSNLKNLIKVLNDLNLLNVPFKNVRFAGIVTSISGAKQLAIIVDEEAIDREVTPPEVDIL